MSGSIGGVAAGGQLRLLRWALAALSLVLVLQAGVAALAVRLGVPTRLAEFSLSGAQVQWSLIGVSLLFALGALAGLALLVWPRLARTLGQAAHQQEALVRMFDAQPSGVFVLDSAACVGERISGAVATLLGRPLSHGEDFRQVLGQWLAPEDQETATLFIRLLLAGRTREKLMRDLNPLREVAINGPRGLRYLCFDFRRFREGEALQLLVEVRDVTEAVSLSRALAASQNRADEQWELMLRLVQVQPEALLGFIDEAAVGLVEVNDRLKSASGRIGEYRALVNHMFRTAHQLKSSATALGLEFIAKDASAFEDQLDTLRGEDRYGGEALAALAATIQQLFEHLAWLRRVAKRFVAQPAVPATPAQSDFQSLILELVRRVAEDQSKHVSPKLNLDAMDQLAPAQAGAVRVITAQLVRNAIAHGIEGPGERAQSGKAGAGQVLVELDVNEPGRRVLRVVDDGRGLCPQRLRTALRESGLRSEAELAELSDQQVIMDIFKRGFTTAEEVSLHAGRGVGLDVVSEAVRRIGGRVRLRSEPGRYTEFRVEFAA